VIGIVLAGGRGRRMGGGKPARVVAGRPLVAYPAAALREALGRVAVVCKPSTELPALPGVERWNEPGERVHPAEGLAYALERAGEGVVVCAADMPFVTADVVRSVAAALGESLVAVAVTGDRLQPLLAAYAPSALDAFRSAPRDEALTRTVARLAPVRVPVGADVARSVDTVEEAVRVEGELLPRLD
jgi:molybdopterin-guanine dinucleotide biosynthesis protein A